MEDNLPTIDYHAYALECSLDTMTACEKCPRQRIVFVGKSTGDDVAEFSGEVIAPDFKTSVDDTEWRG